jgi:hypothetical protein
MKDLSRVLLYLCLVLVVALVVWVEGATNPFTVWNILPLLLAWFMVRRAAGRSPQHRSPQEGRAGAAAAFTLAVVAVVGTAHLAWVFDWHGTATGSSTAALIFVVLPVLAVLAGALAWAVVKLATIYAVNRKRKRNP